MVSSTPRQYFNPGKHPVPIVQEAGWAPGPVLTAGKSRPTGIISLDHPACSQSLYQLTYPAHTSYMTRCRFLITHVLACLRVEVTLPHVHRDARTFTEGTSPSDSFTTLHKLRKKVFLYNTTLFGSEMWQRNADDVYGNMMTVWKSGCVG